MPMILIILSISLEYLPEYFNHIPFKYQVPDLAGYVFDTTYKDAIWYFIQGLFSFVAMVFVFFLIPSRYIAANIIGLSPVTWWGIELYQKFCWLAKINDSRLYVSDSAKWQLFIALFLVIGGLYGLYRYKS